MINYAAIGLISAATILLELALLRLFAVQQFYHFAFMAISLALLGAGASGSVLSIRSRSFSSPILSLIFGLSTLAAYLVINYLPFDSFSIAWDSRQLGYLALYFLSAAVPFFFTGLIVGGELMTTGRAADGQAGGGSHLVYGSNLIGSAAGALITLPVLALIGGEGAVFLAAALGSAAGLLFVYEEWKRGRGAGGIPFKVAALGAVITICLVIVLTRPSFLDQRLSPYKALSVLSNALDSRQLFTGWDAAARIDAVESSAIHVMPGLSLSSAVGPPSQIGLTIDGDNLMPINGLSPESSQAQTLAENLPVGLAHQLRPASNTLVLEAGAGSDVLFALAMGAASVTAVEENSLIIDLVQNQLNQYSGELYRKPQVEVVNQSNRVFAGQYGLGRQLGEGEYDLAILSLTDTHRPVTSGAYSLTEDYRYTVEAFEDYIKTLNNDGILMVTRWLQTPPTESARTFGSIAESLNNLGLNPGDHLVAFRTLRTMTILASPEPFSAKETKQIRDYLDKRGFDIVYYSGVQPGELNRHNLISEPVYHSLFEQILSDSEWTYKDYRFDIRPPRDDRPFYHHYFKWRQTPEILASLGLTWQPFGGSGYFVLVALLILVLLASIILIIGPLILSGKAKGLREAVPIRYWRPRVLVYFACLGLAFLFVELPLAQQFILLLDQPVTALAVVLFSILFFSGIGSLTVRLWPLRWGLTALVLLIVLYPYILGAFSGWALGLEQWARVGTAILITAPLGYLMGLPFAGGLAVVEGQQPALVPWSWGINGTFSVISSVLAVMIALSLGFSAVFWLGAAAYALALLVFYRLM